MPNEDIAFMEKKSGYDKDTNAFVTIKKVSVKKERKKKMEEMKKMEREEVAVEKAKIVENKGCSACAVGALCLADGPIPDFEIAGVSAVFGVTG